MDTFKACLNYDQLRHDFQEWPAIKLIKADNAPFILDFFYRHFRQPQRASIPHDEFLELLDECLKMRHKETPDLYTGSAHQYTREWATNRFIQIRPSAENRFVVVLGPGTECVLTWFEQEHSQPFVGTESKFIHVVQWLEDIKQEATEDPESRIQRLTSERERIEQQITQIRETKQVIRRLSDTQLRELYLEICHTARQLESDFSLVERQFQEMAITLRDAHLQAIHKKGALVAQVLDVSEDIRKSDQGQSFYAFCRFLMEPDRQAKFYELLDIASRLPMLQTVAAEGYFLRRLPGHLIDLSASVMRSINRVIAQLRRILDGKEIGEHHRLSALLRDIQQQALCLAQAPPTEDIIATIEGNPLVQLPLAYRFWQRQEPQQFYENLTLMRQDDQGTALATLLQQALFKKEELIERINQVLEQQPEATLAEVVQQHPLSKGLSEILLYWTIAEEYPQHSVDTEETEHILSFSVSEEEVYTKVYHLPLLTFRRRSYAGISA